MKRTDQMLPESDLDQANYILLHALRRPNCRILSQGVTLERAPRRTTIRDELWRAVGHSVPFYAAPTETIVCMSLLAETLMMPLPLEKRIFTLNPREQLTSNRELQRWRVQ